MYSASWKIWTELWTGLDWTGLDWTRLWTGLDKTLDWTGLDWTSFWGGNFGGGGGWGPLCYFF